MTDGSQDEPIQKFRGPSRRILILCCFVLYTFIYDEKAVSYFQKDLHQNRDEITRTAKNDTSSSGTTNESFSLHITDSLSYGSNMSTVGSNVTGEYLIYVITLQGVNGSDKGNEHRLDDLRRHWGILCGPDMNIQFQRCPGKLNPPGPIHRGYSLSLAYIDCFDRALEENRMSKEEPFVFLEDDARLYNPNFCRAEYRERLYNSVPENATLLMLGGHGMETYEGTGTYRPKDPDLPVLQRPKFGAGSYGFVIMNADRLQYFRRKLVKMTNRTLDQRGMYSFKAIDRQFYLYPMLKSYMPIPWIVYHEGGLYSNTKGIVRGEFGGGSQQYRWIPGLTGSFKNCTGNFGVERMTNNNIDQEGAPAVVAGAANRSGDIKDDFVIVSCQKVRYRLPSHMLIRSNNNSSKSIITGIVSGSKFVDRRQAIRNTWGANHPTNVIFLIAGPWNDIQLEFQEYGDILWIQYDNNVTNEGIANDPWIDTLKTASFLTLMDEITHKSNNNIMDYRYLVKVMDHSYVHIAGIESRLANLERNGSVPAMWGSNCGTGVRPGHLHLEEKEYSDYFFPEYCQGHGYALSREFVSCAAKHIPITKLLSSDDAYIGLLGERCGLTSDHFRSEAEMERNGQMPLMHHGMMDPESMRHYHTLQMLNHSHEIS